MIKIRKRIPNFIEHTPEDLIEVTANDTDALYQSEVLQEWARDPDFRYFQKFQYPSDDYIYPNWGIIVARVWQPKLGRLQRYFMARVLEGYEELAIDEWNPMTDPEPHNPDPRRLQIPAR